MAQHAILLEDDEQTIDRNTLAEAVSESLDISTLEETLERDVSLEKVLTGEEHPEWEIGDPCPECDSPKISVMGTTESRYESQDGNMEFVAVGDAIGPEISYMCPACSTLLLETPVIR